jgi:hypothetical protein
VSDVAQAVATIAAGLFAGAAIYINVAEHPARMECGTPLAATVFAPSYRRAAVMQAALALIGPVAGIVAWWTTAAPEWLAGSALLFLVVPFTLLVIMRTNQRLLDPALDRSAPQTRELLLKWGRLHAVRSVLGAAGFVVFVLAA